MKGQWITYTSEEVEFLRLNREMNRRELTSAFNKRFDRDISQENIKAKCQREGFKTGRTGCFEKGHVPHPNAKPKGPNNTSFKKGNRPYNWKPVGSERINAEGYIEVKIKEPRTWQLKHRRVWEQHHGKIETGMNIRFIDNDRTNCNIENLEAVSDSLNATLNRSGYSSLPTELKPTMKAVCQLTQKTRQLSRERQGI